MSRHNPVASRRRRLPYIAKIKRDDLFCPEDEREIEVICKRIAAAGEFMVLAGWREDAGYRVFHFGTWAKARAMQHWIDRSGIVHRPMPKLGETPQEREERRREALAWGLETGAVHAVVQAYRQARDRGESELAAFNAAADAALALGRPLDKVNDTARMLIDWAAKGPMRIGNSLVLALETGDQVPFGDHREKYIAVKLDTARVGMAVQRLEVVDGGHGRPLLEVEICDNPALEVALDRAPYVGCGPGQQRPARLELVLHRQVHEMDWNALPPQILPVAAVARVGGERLGADAGEARGCRSACEPPPQHGVEVGMVESEQIDAQILARNLSLYERAPLGHYRIALAPATSFLAPRRGSTRIDHAGVA